MVTFGTGQFAACMRAGMKDVVDIYAIENKANNPITFDKLMGIFENNSANEGAVRFSDCEPDFKTMSFVIPKGFDEVTIKPSYYCQYNYAKLRNGTSGTYFYAFITGIEPVNSEATRFTFTIDWWHTHFKNTYKPLPKLKKAYVTRRNTHNISEAGELGGTYLYIDVGHGAESQSLYDLQQLENETLYTTIKDTTGYNPDTLKLSWVRAGLTEDHLSFTVKLGTVTLNYSVSSLTRSANGLYYVYIPIVDAPYTEDNELIVFTATGETEYKGAISSTTENYHQHCYAVTAAIGTQPACASLEFVQEVPCVNSYKIGKVTISVELNASILELDSANCKVYKTWGDGGVKLGYIPLIQLKEEAETVNARPFIVASESVTADTVRKSNFPKDTCFIPQADYSHKLNRTTSQIEPKLAQPQYSKVEFTNNQNSSFSIAPYQWSSALTTLTVRGDYNGSIFKQKFYIDGYCGDNGKQYTGVSNQLGALPLINDKLIDYLDANKNSMKTGLAITREQYERNLAYAGIGYGADTVANIANTVQDFGGKMPVRSGANGVLKQATLGLNLGIEASKLSHAQTDYMRTHASQMADLAQQARTASTVSGGNNAEFDFIDNNGKIVRKKWIPSIKDRKRLVEYFHKNGYAVGEYEQDVSLDTMYYFDYIEATNINFATSGNYNNETDVINLETMGVACEEYIRNMFADGVRIWHGRAPQEDTGDKSFQFFETPYLNTAKEY